MESVVVGVVLVPYWCCGENDEVGNLVVDDLPKMIQPMKPLTTKL